MPGPMEGITVVELGLWVAGPAAAGILGDWGADVIKVEPPDGDPFRGLLSAAGLDGSSPPFELDNRNKRSMGLNLAVEEGRGIAAELVDGADVFVTNARPGALARAGLDYETVAADMARRDALDQGRETDPLRRADGALELDTSDMTVDEIVDSLAGRIGDG